MPYLSLVYPYPSQGRADRPADDDAVADVALRSLRPVAELYSEALVGLRLPNPLTELRIFTHHAWCVSAPVSVPIRGSGMLGRGRTFATVVRNSTSQE